MILSDATGPMALRPSDPKKDIAFWDFSMSRCNSILLLVRPTFSTGYRLKQHACVCRGRITRLHQITDQNDKTSHSPLFFFYFNRSTVKN